MILAENFVLPNGVKIPKLGLGTWMIPNADAAQAVQQALAIGYRHIDTAQVYGNERGVGEGIRGASVKREDIFVTTKLGAEKKSYSDAVASIDRSLSRMGLEYIDMMIIHSPQPWMKYGKKNRYLQGNREAWQALEEAYAAGKLRAIGVSNFIESDLDNILASCSVQPMVNQILAHISNTPDELIHYCQQKGILVEAYSPIGHGELMKNEQIVSMAQKYSVSVPQLSIRYTLQLGLLPLPKTANPEHMKNNADLDFVISENDMTILKNLPQIKDYGAASIMPVFGGKLKPRSILSSLLGRGKKRGKK